MKMQTVAFGVVLLIVGVVVAVLYGLNPGNVIGRTHAYIPAGGIGLAVLGGIVIALGVTSKTIMPSEQFKCEKCGATFGSDPALKSHSKDKHGM